MNEKYAVIDIFAGAGGLSKAFLEAGAEVVWANELDKNACNLYRENFKNVHLVEGDIHNVKEEDIPQFDFLVGSIPYQFSSVTRRNIELNILDNKIIRIIKARRPRGFLLDSIALKNHDSRSIFEILIDELQKEGYYIKSAILNSKEYGNIPHNKERRYLVGFKEKSEYEIFEFPSKTQLTNNVNDIINIHEAKDEVYYSDKNIEILKDIKGNEIKDGLIYQLRPNSAGLESNVSEFCICPALTAYIRSIPMIKDNTGIRRLTANEYFGFQGFHDIKIPFESNGYKWYRYAANCSSVAVTKRIAKNILLALDGMPQDVVLENPVVNVDNNFNHEGIDLKRDNELHSIDCNAEVFKQTNENKATKTEIEKGKYSKSEKDYTINKVIPALKKQGCFDVRYNHGNDEYGKDITYKYKDNFETVKCGAVQVKRGDISGGAQGKINSILNQIEAAFSVPFIDIKENKELYISQILIVCSGKYTKYAKEEIRNKSKKGYDVRFFDGQDIDNLLD